MQSVINGLNWIAGLGPMVMMPIIMFVIGVALRQKIGSLFRSCILTGVGFAGVNLTINFFIAKVSPSVLAMVQTWGLKTDIMDVGWPARAAATWAFPMAAIVVFVVLGVNIIMLALKLTNCVMVDFWSYNHFIFGAALSWYTSGSIVVALITGGLIAAITFKLADWTQPLCEEAFGIPGVSFPTSNSIGWAPLAWLLNKLYDKIPGFNKIKADPTSIQKRFGVLGEPMVVGSIMGLGIGILGGNSVGDTLIVAMSTATAMVLTPKMMQILMEGLIPFSEGIKDFLNTKFEGNRFHIGIDAALTIANPSVIAVGLLMVPTTILLAAMVPGNRLLPLSDIAYMGMWLAAWPVAFGKGNVIRGYISCIIFTCIMLLISTGMAEIHTQLAISGGFKLADGMKLISTEDAGTHIIEYIFSIINRFFAK
ncbi:PTS galactitol transporter subunit IIC [Fusibacter ferrireducens]|uniref:PTS maltose transporter subunit IIABC n=1 Tax=Fusibacter ferrireducens TaxID=2785058 RepID=A0ABS0A1P3_9FIRM|nr:PTS transporter subunit IIC [Fusibacter ferrireducens]MBF4695779.1 PTS maltose transporter subunit IIABC [Fusibacter ferrireducens]